MTDSQVLKGSAEEDEIDLGWKVVPLANGAGKEGLLSVYTGLQAVRGCTRRLLGLAS